MSNVVGGGEDGVRDIINAKLGGTEEDTRVVDSGSWSDRTSTIINHTWRSDASGVAATSSALLRLTSRSLTRSPERFHAGVYSHCVSA